MRDIPSELSVEAASDDSGSTLELARKAAEQKEQEKALFGSESSSSESVQVQSPNDDPGNKGSDEKESQLFWDSFDKENDIKSNLSSGQASVNETPDDKTETDHEPSFLPNARDLPAIHVVARAPAVSFPAVPPLVHMRNHHVKSSGGGLSKQPIVVENDLSSPLHEDLANAILGKCKVGTMERILSFLLHEDDASGSAQAEADMLIRRKTELALNGKEEVPDVGSSITIDNLKAAGQYNGKSVKVLQIIDGNDNKKSIVFQDPQSDKSQRISINNGFGPVTSVVRLIRARLELLTGENEPADLGVDSAVNRLNSLPLTRDPQTNFYPKMQVRIRSPEFNVGTIVRVDTDAHTVTVTTEEGEEKQLSQNDVYPLGDYQFSVKPYLCTDTFLRSLLERCSIALTDERPFSWWKILQVRLMRNGLSLNSSTVPGAKIGVHCVTNSRFGEFDSPYAVNQLKFSVPGALELIVDPLEHCDEEEKVSLKAELFSMINVRRRSPGNDMIWNIVKIQPESELFMDKQDFFASAGTALRNKAQDGVRPFSFRRVATQKFLKKFIFEKSRLPRVLMVHDVQQRIRWVSDCVWIQRIRNPNGPCRIVYDNTARNMFLPWPTEDDVLRFDQKMTKYLDVFGQFAKIKQSGTHDLTEAQLKNVLEQVQFSPVRQSTYKFILEVLARTIRLLQPDMACDENNVCMNPNLMLPSMARGSPEYITTVGAPISWFDFAMNAINAYGENIRAVVDLSIAIPVLTRVRNCSAVSGIEHYLGLAILTLFDTETLYRLCGVLPYLQVDAYEKTSTLANINGARASPENVEAQVLGLVDGDVAFDTVGARVPEKKLIQYVAAWTAQMDSSVSMLANFSYFSADKKNTLFQARAEYAAACLEMAKHWMQADISFAQVPRDVKAKMCNEAQIPDKQFAEHFSNEEVRAQQAGQFLALANAMGMQTEVNDLSAKLEEDKSFVPSITGTWYAAYRQMNKKKRALETAKENAVQHIKDQQELDKFSESCIASVQTLHELCMESSPFIQESITWTNKRFLNDLTFKSRGVPEDLIFDEGAMTQLSNCLQSELESGRKKMFDSEVQKMLFFCGFSKLLPIDKCVQTDQPTDSVSVRQKSIKNQMDNRDVDNNIQATMAKANLVAEGSEGEYFKRQQQANKETENIESGAFYLREGKKGALFLLARWSDMYEFVRQFKTEQDWIKAVPDGSETHHFINECMEKVDRCANEFNNAFWLRTLARRQMKFKLMRFGTSPEAYFAARERLLLDYMDPTNFESDTAPAPLSDYFMLSVYSQLIEPMGKFFPLSGVNSPPKTLKEMPSERDTAEDVKWLPHAPWTKNEAVVNAFKSSADNRPDPEWVNNAVKAISNGFLVSVGQMRDLFLPCSNDQCCLKMGQLHPCLGKRCCHLYNEYNVPEFQPKQYQKYNNFRTNWEIWKKSVLGGEAMFNQMLQFRNSPSAESQSNVVYREYINAMKENDQSRITAVQLELEKFDGVRSVHEECNRGLKVVWKTNDNGEVCRWREVDGDLVEDETGELVEEKEPLYHVDENDIPIKFKHGDDDYPIVEDGQWIEDPDGFPIQQLDENEEPIYVTKMTNDPTYFVCERCGNDRVTVLFKGTVEKRNKNGTYVINYGDNPGTDKFVPRQYIRNLDEGEVDTVEIGDTVLGTYCMSKWMCPEVAPASKHAKNDERDTLEREMDLRDVREQTERKQRNIENQFKENQQNTLKKSETTEETST